MPKTRVTKEALVEALETIANYPLPTYQNKEHGPVVKLEHADHLRTLAKEVLGK